MVGARADSQLFDGIVHSQNVLSFGWKGITRPLTADFYDGPILAVSFLKFRDDLLKDRGVQFEYSVAAKLHETFGSSQEVAVNVLGSLGWSEMIVLIAGRDIEEVTRAAFRIRAWEQREGEPTFLSSITLPSVNYQYLMNDEGLITGPPSLAGKVLPNISVVCRPEAEAYVAKLAEEFFPRSRFVVTHTLGKTDIQISGTKADGDSESGNLVDFADLVFKLQSFRARILQEAPESVHSTSTIIGHPDAYPTSNHSEGGEAVASSGTRPASRGGAFSLESVVPDRKAMQLIAEGPPEMENQTLFAILERLFFLFNAHARNPLLAGAFEDLLPFMRTLKENIEKVRVWPDEVGEEFRQLPSMMPTVIQAFSQRMSGTHSYLLEADDAFLTYPTGIQRVLTAANAIPRTAVESAGLAWKGFVTMGQPNVSWARNHHGAINVPMESMLRPRDWILLYHEIGHEIGHITRLLDRDEVRKFVNEELGLSGLDSHESLNLVWEIFSDLFSFQFGFGADLDRYIGHVWTFLAKRLNSAQDAREYFSRLLFVSCYANGKKKLTDDDQEWLAAESNRLAMAVDEVLSRREWLSPQQAYEDVWKYRHVLPLLTDQVGRLAEPGLYEDEQFEGTDEGRVVKLNSRTIPHFLQSLNEAASFQESIAALLSLWDMEMRARKRPL